MLKFILGFKDWSYKTKERYYSSLFCKVISFVIQGSDMGLFCGQNFEREYINVLLNSLLLCVIIQIGK